MSQEVKLLAVVRDQKGKGAARRARRAGRIPAVVYTGGKEATSLELDPKDLAKALMGPYRRNVLIDLDVQDASGASKGSKKVMVRELQKDPVRRTPLHVDFVELDMAKPIVVAVPFFATGRSRAVIAGGKMQVPMRTLRVRCLPSNIPEKIELDTTEFDIGVYRAKDVPMPQGAELVDDGHLTVVTISRGRGAAAGEGEGEG